MADSLLGNGADALEETLGRLNKKSGVKATIVLDRTTGAILKTSGQISAIRTSKNPESSSALPTQTAGSFSSESNPQGSESQAVVELAGLVWNFVNNAGDLIHDLDTEDELKLLRLRSKRQELVIVPDTKYLLVVVHDTPPA
ncbi:hypothetical protein CONLIGDRAFT_653632 [Coniochaeta ligniaria NRRL 30616]|uniref:Roadblock/LAMTOR2 domain-containing protein n=1 Tax=Coniochaeta ligniaria NRRL 30616 TaxID=1408157 RepID=A0A1J7ITW5_9PEZI|nr:hypothetical protein CONLIGDRAFT_653632 [Coniochaeta ligniaria NRRL 30616]